MQTHSKKQIRNVRLVQARIPLDVAYQAKLIMNHNRLSWQSVLTACLRQFVDENARLQKKSA